MLAASVSREHAELKQSDAGWHVRDLGSRNGTFVDGTRVQGRVPLGERVRLSVGDVKLWFLSDARHEPSSPPSLATASAGGGLVRYRLATEGVELLLVGSSDQVAGGALLSRAPGAETWTERGLAPLEYQLLRALCGRAAEEAARHRRCAAASRRASSRVICRGNRSTPTRRTCGRSCGACVRSSASSAARASSRSRRAAAITSRAGQRRVRSTVSVGGLSGGSGGRLRRRSVSIATAATTHPRTIKATKLTWFGLRVYEWSGQCVHAILTR